MPSACKEWIMLKTDIETNGEPQTPAEVEDFRSKVASATAQTIEIMSNCGCDEGKQEAVDEIQSSTLTAPYKTALLNGINRAQDTANEIHSL